KRVQSPPSLTAGRACALAPATRSTLASAAASVPGAPLAKEASERRAGQYLGYGQATRAPDPAASGARSGEGRLRRPGARPPRGADATPLREPCVARPPCPAAGWRALGLRARASCRRQRSWPARCERSRSAAIPPGAEVGTPA